MHQCILIHSICCRRGLDIRSIEKMKMLAILRIKLKNLLIKFLLKTAVIFDINLFNRKVLFFLGIMGLFICLVFKQLWLFEVVLSEEITPTLETELTWEQLTLKEQLRFGEVYFNAMYPNWVALNMPPAK